MSYIVSITDSQLMTAIGDWLCSILGLTPPDVVQAHDNRVPEPDSQFICMDQIFTDRHATNQEVDDTIAGTTTYIQPVTSTIQLDVYGKTSDDWQNIITTLWRSELAVDFLAPYGVAPLYSDRPRHIPMVNGEQQYEKRWVITLYAQYNLAVVAPQQFMDAVEINIINAGTYPLQ